MCIQCEWYVHPIMSMTYVLTHYSIGNSDNEAIRMANNCDFALSSCAFSGDYNRARKIAAGLTAGMSAVNDLEGIHSITYLLSHSLTHSYHAYLLNHLLIHSLTRTYSLD